MNLEDEKKLETVRMQYELDSIDRLLIKQLVEFPQTLQKELAEMVGLSAPAINHRVNKPAFKSAMDEILGSTEEHLKEAAKRAARRLKKLVEHEDPTIAMPFVKMALSNHLTQKVDLNIKPIVRYRTTVEADGSLLQTMVDEDAKANEEQGT